MNTLVEGKTGAGHLSTPPSYHGHGIMYPVHQEHCFCLILYCTQPKGVPHPSSLYRCGGFTQPITHLFGDFRINVKYLPLIFSSIFIVEVQVSFP